MDRMSPLDATFLELEHDDPHASLHIGSTAVFEGPPPTYDELLTAMAGRLPLIPRYRQKVRRVPAALGAPVWVDDPRFDLRYHLRNTAIPAPGGDRELATLIGRLMSQRLDLERSPWEVWLVHGLSGDRWAVVSKVHHCMVDGVSGTDLLTVTFDLQREPAPPVPDEWSPQPEPSDLRLAADAVIDLIREPFELARSGAGALRHPKQTAARAAATAKGLLTMSGALRPTHRSSLIGPLTSSRIYTWAGASAEDVAATRQAFGGTLNDVVIAAITAGFRDLLLHRGEQPDRHTIRTLVPVSVRARGEEHTRDNQVSALLPELPVEEDDPIKRFFEVRRRLQLLKSSGEAVAGTSVTTLARFAPFDAVTAGLRLVFHLPQQQLTTVTTNVPGPPFPLYALGREMLEALPYVPIASRIRLGISIFTYNGRLRFGITGDRDANPDIEVLAGGIERGLEELAKLARDRVPAATS